MEDQSGGIQWTLFLALQHLDFADDLALVSHTHQHIQEKILCLSTYALQIGLKISQRKTEEMRLNIPSPSPVQVNGDLPMTYLENTDNIFFPAVWFRVLEHDRQ